MATASLNCIEVINHPTSHTASVESILSECGKYPAQSRGTSGQTGTAQGIGGSYPTPVAITTGSPTRRSASVVRRHRHSKKSGGLDCEQSSVTKQQQRRSQYVSGFSEAAARTEVFTTHSRSAEPRKSNTLTAMNTTKESGGRKILNFFQRGFIPRRPKSITKLDHRKVASGLYHGSAESLEDTRKIVSMVTSPIMALCILDQQITLPLSLRHAFQLDAVNSPWDETVHGPTHKQHIRPIDSSLMGPDFRHCFQVATCNAGTLVVKPSDRATMTNYIATTNHSSFPSQPTVCSSGLTLNHGRKLDLSDTEMSHPIDKWSNTVRTYVCSSAIERSRWMLYLRRLVHPGLDTERRRENCLHIWIQEAKGLTDKHRYHCEVLLDGVTYARTTSKCLTDMLFWGEEFDLSGLPEFSTLIIELWQDSNRAVPDLTTAHRPHTNFPPPRITTSAPSPHTRHTTHSETFAILQSPMPARKATMMMSCTRGSTDLLRSDDVPQNNEDSNRTMGDNNEYYATVTGHVLRERTDNVLVGHKPSGPNKSAPVRRRAARRDKLKSHKHYTEAQLVAIVSLPASKLNGLSEVESWYPATLYDPLSRHKHVDLQGITQTTGKSRNQKSINGTSQNNGTYPSSPIQLRIKTRYRSVVVLPLTSYTHLQHYLSRFCSPPVSAVPCSTVSGSGNQVDATLLLSSLDPWLSVKAKAELASSVVAFQQAIGQAPQFLVVLILHEVSKQADPNMVLRGNSIATKATEIYLRLVGETYLSRVLTDFVHNVLTGGDDGGIGRPGEPQQAGRNPKQARITPGFGFPDCEVDTSKLQSSSQLVQNQSHLIHLVETVWNRIVASEAYFPDKLRMIFAAVRTYLDAAYPPQQLPSNMSKSMNAPQATLSEHVISACLFLRYICPAILSPSLFGLTPEFPSEPRVLRAFTLVAKTIQSLANFSLFSGSKEVYMTFMNPFVSNQLPAMRQFLYAISSPRASVPRPIPVTAPITSACHTSTYYDGATEPLTQSICFSSPAIGKNRATMLTSHSHHGTFLGEANPSDPDLLSDTALLTRSISGLPASSASETFVISRPNTVESTLADTQWIRASHFDFDTLPQSPIILPPLPVAPNTSQPGDHVDLALCLALCHLQLSEAVQKIPSEKMPSHVSNIKPILEEIDFFLASGVQPDPNWEYQHFDSNVPSPQQPALTQLAPSANSIDLHSIHTTVSTNRSMSLDRSQMESVSFVNNSATCTTSFSAAVQVSDHGQNMPICDHQTISSTGNQVKPTQNQPSVVNGLTPRICERLFVLPRSPSQKAFAPSNDRTCVESQVVRSRSGSELLRGGSGGGVPYLSNYHPATPSKLDSSAPSPEVQLRSTIYVPNVYAADYEQTPTPPPYSKGNNGSQNYPQSIWVSGNHKPNFSLEDSGAPWSLDTGPHIPRTLSTATVVTVGLNPVQSSSATQIKSRPIMFPIDHPSSLNQTYHTTNSTSSGYQSLRSHDLAATAVPGAICRQNYNEYNPVIFEKEHRRPRLNTNSIVVSSSSSSAIASMSNPLYAFHEPHSSPLSHATDDDSFIASRNDDPRTPPAQAIPVRAKSEAPLRSDRRHTYVNLANAPDVETIFTSLQTTNLLRRASITSDPNGLDAEDPVSRDSYSSGIPSAQQCSTQISTDMKTALTTTAECACGSLITVASDPTECASEPSMRAHSSHRSVSTNSEFSRQRTMLQGTTEGSDFRMPSNERESIMNDRLSMGKRTAVFQTEPRLLDPTSIRDELDASQARLAEAQARLLANEAERIQLLRAWHNELMKQSQLVTYGAQSGSQIVQEIAKMPQVESEALTIPRSSYSDTSALVHRRDTIPLTTNSQDHHHVYSDASISSNPTLSLTRTSSRQLYGGRPRMGATVLGAGYHETHVSCTAPSGDFHQATISCGRPQFGSSSQTTTMTNTASSANFMTAAPTDDNPPRDGGYNLDATQNPSSLLVQTQNMVLHSFSSPTDHQHSRIAYSCDNTAESTGTISYD